MRMLGTLCDPLIGILIGTLAVSASAIAGPQSPHYVNGLGAAMGEANFVIQSFPPPFSTVTGSLTPRVYGQIYQRNMTGFIGGNTSIIAQLGYGPVGSNPLVNDSAWAWLNAPYNGPTISVRDEYERQLIGPAPGVYHYTYRFNLSPTTAAADVGWTIADRDGAGSDPGLSFDPANLGVMTVTPAPTAATLLGIGGWAMIQRRRR
jgi:hypothetical protein